MVRVNENYLKIQSSYLFTEIAHRVKAFSEKNPSAKIIRLGIGDVTEPLPPAVIEAMHKAVDVRAGASGHDVRIDIHGVDRVGNRDLDVLPEKLLDVAAVALGAVGNEDLVRSHIDAAILEVGFGDRLAQEAVTLFRTVSVE